MNKYSKYNKLNLNLIDPLSLDESLNIQEIVEDNVDKLFELNLIKSNCVVEEFKIDSLCYSKKNKSFTSIAYQKVNENVSITDKGNAFLSEMTENKDKLVYFYNQIHRKEISKNEITWNNMSVNIISPKFNSYQVKGMRQNSNSKLWEYQLYQDDIFIFNQLTSNILNIPEARKVFRVEYDIDSSISKPRSLLDEIKEAISKNFKNVNFYKNSFYTGVKIGKKGLCYINYSKQHQGYLVEMERGYKSPENIKSPHFFTIPSDSYQLLKEKVWTHDDGRKGYRYQMYIVNKKQISNMIHYLNYKYKTIT